MDFPFEKLEVWQEVLEYGDVIEAIAAALPDHEQANLSDQIRRASTGLALHIAGGTSVSDYAEHGLGLSRAQRSLVETVACLHLIRRRGYLQDPRPLHEAYRTAKALRQNLAASQQSLDASRRDGTSPYDPAPMV